MLMPGLGKPVRQALPVLGAVLAAAVLIAVYNHGQREIGRRDQAISDSRAQLAALRAVNDSLAHTFRAETVEASKWRVRYDTVRVSDLAHVLDSLQAAGIGRPDTVRIPVPVRVLVTADSAVHSCTLALNTCAVRLRADSAERVQLRLQIQALQHAEPSGFATWSTRLLWAAAGVGIGAVIRR